MITKRKKLIAFCLFLFLGTIALLFVSPKDELYIVPKEEKRLHHKKTENGTLFLECWRYGPPIPLSEKERFQLEEVLRLARQYPPEGSVINLNTHVTYDVEYSVKALIPFYEAYFLFSSDGSLVNGSLAPVDEIRLREILLPVIERAKKNNVSRGEIIDSENLDF